jgi:hypothetical protein
MRRRRPLDIRSTPVSGIADFRLVLRLRPVWVSRYQPCRHVLLHMFRRLIELVSHECRGLACHPGLNIRNVRHYVRACGAFWIVRSAQFNGLSTDPRIEAKVIGTTRYAPHIARRSPCPDVTSGPSCRPQRRSSRLRLPVRRTRPPPRLRRPAARCPGATGARRLRAMPGQPRRARAPA